MSRGDQSPSGCRRPSRACPPDHGARPPAPRSASVISGRCPTAPALHKTVGGLNELQVTQHGPRARRECDPSPVAPAGLGPWSRTPARVPRRDDTAGASTSPAPVPAYWREPCTSRRDNRRVVTVIASTVSRPRFRHPDHQVEREGGVRTLTVWRAAGHSARGPPRRWRRRRSARFRFMECRPPARRSCRSSRAPRETSHSIAAAIRRRARPRSHGRTARACDLGCPRVRLRAVAGPDGGRQAALRSGDAPPARAW